MEQFWIEVLKFKSFVLLKKYFQKTVKVFICLPVYKRKKESKSDLLPVYKISPLYGGPYS